MNLRQFQDDGGKTVAWRVYRSDAERQQAVIALMPLADDKEIRWHETPLHCPSAQDPLGQQGCVGFVVLEDQSELLASLRVRLHELAASAKDAQEMETEVKRLMAYVLPCNWPEFADMLESAGKVFHARFAGPIGRVLLKFGTSAIAYDFDSLKVDVTGLEFTRQGVLTKHNAEDLAGADYVMIQPRKEK